CPKWTHCRKALVTEASAAPPPESGGSQVDSLPKGIGDPQGNSNSRDDVKSPKWTHCRKALVTPGMGMETMPRFRVSQVDSLPKGIGDLLHGGRDCPRGRVSQVDSLPKGIGDSIDSMTGPSGPPNVPSGLTAERHW